jgi:hypothetical protein
MAHVPAHTPRYVPVRTNQGWGAVGLVVVLTIACIVMTTVIYQRTYKHPTDPTWHAVGGADNPTKGTGH